MSAEHISTAATDGKEGGLVSSVRNIMDDDLCVADLLIMQFSTISLSAADVCVTFYKFEKSILQKRERSPRIHERLCNMFGVEILSRDLIASVVRCYSEKSKANRIFPFHGSDVH